MAYQGVMAKKQRVVEEVERRLEEQRRREKEELKRLLKQYNKNQIQDIDDQTLLKGKMDYDMERAGLYGSDYDEDDDYSDEELSPWAQKYGKSVSPSRPMFDPYDMQSKPYFNDEQSKQISSLLDNYNNSLSNSLSKTMDLNMGSFMMMNRYNPQFKMSSRAKLPAIDRNDIVNKVGVYYLMVEPIRQDTPHDPEDQQHRRLREERAAEGVHRSDEPEETAGPGGRRQGHQPTTHPLTHHNITSHRSALTILKRNIRSLFSSFLWTMAFMWIS